jgi:hypothetical protein
MNLAQLQEQIVNIRNICKEQGMTDSQIGALEILDKESIGSTPVYSRVNMEVGKRKGSAEKEGFYVLLSYEQSKIFTTNNTPYSNNPHKPFEKYGK